MLTVNLLTVACSCPVKSTHPIVLSRRTSPHPFNERAGVEQTVVSQPQEVSTDTHHRHGRSGHSSEVRLAHEDRQGRIGPTASPQHPASPLSEPGYQYQRGRVRRFKRPKRCLKRFS